MVYLLCIRPAASVLPRHSVRQPMTFDSMNSLRLAYEYKGQITIAKDGNYYHGLLLVKDYINVVSLSRPEQFTINYNHTIGRQLTLNYNYTISLTNTGHFTLLFKLLLLQGSAVKQRFTCLQQQLNCLQHILISMQKMLAIT